MKKGLLDWKIICLLCCMNNFENMQNVNVVFWTFNDFFELRSVLTVGMLRLRELCQSPFRRIFPWISPLDMVLGAPEVCLLLCYYFIWLSRNNNMRQPGFQPRSVDWPSALEPNTPRGPPSAHDLSLSLFTQSIKNLLKKQKNDICL